MASNIHGVPLATDEKTVVRHRIYTPTLISATGQHSIANDLATIQHAAMLQQHFRLIGAELSALYRVAFAFGDYTAPFHMQLRHTCRTSPMAEPHSFCILQRGTIFCKIGLDVHA